MNRWIVEYYDEGGELHVSDRMFTNQNEALDLMADYRRCGFRAGVRRIKL
jgi:hypothetical protein